MGITNVVHTNFECGFGTPNSVPDPTYYDHGFGATESITISNPFAEVEDYVYRNTSERCFGDPHGNIGAYVDGDDVRFSDNGGQIAVIRAKFKDTYENNFPQNKSLGPYRVVFESITNDGVIFPSYGGVSGRGKNLYTTINQDKLYACLPVMPKGQYNARIYWGDGFLNRIDIFNALTIVHRNRYDASISIKSKMPAWLKRGKVSDNYLPSQAYKKGEDSKIAVLTESFAEVLDYTVSSSYTVTTAIVKRGATSIPVETTLSFPDKGYIFIGRQKLYYKSKTDVSFDGIETALTHIIRKNARVEPNTSEFASLYNFFDRNHLDILKPKWQMRDEDWMKAFKVIKFGEKQNTPVIFQYLYHLLASSITPIPCTVSSSGEVLNPTTATTFVEAYRNKFVVLEKDLGNEEYERRWFKLNTTSAGVGYLSKYGTSYHMGTYFGENSDWLNETVTARVLPFWIEKDSGCQFKIVLDEAVLPINPGFIDKDFIDFNVYLGADDIGRGTNIFKFLVAGVKGEFTVRDWGHDTDWPRSLIQDFRPQSLILEPSRQF